MDKQDYLLKFAQGISANSLDPCQLDIQMHRTFSRHKLTSLSPGLIAACATLVTEGGTEEQLAGMVSAVDGPSGFAMLYHYLHLFAKRQMLAYAINVDGAVWATIQPISNQFRFEPSALDPHKRFMLSRFACIHREGEEMVLESPLCHGKIIMHDSRAASLVSALASPHSADSLPHSQPAIPQALAVLFLGMLVAGGFADAVPAGQQEPEESIAQRHWSFHELLFHARSRSGRHANPSGGTYRFLRRIDPLPLVKKIEAAEVIDLFRPDMEALTLADELPFSLVMEERASVREYSDRSIDARQLGEFLYRTARIKQKISNEHQDLSQRIYPSGGAIYELELYLTIHACEGVPRGFYHYCPDLHRLEKIETTNEQHEALLRDARSSSGLDANPQVLITISARFERLFWKYESMAYSVMLKNVGTLYQTMYLVATAMDLAPCALGGGDSDLFTRVAGTDYLEESSVGEFMLGRKWIG